MDARRRVARLLLALLTAISAVQCLTVLLAAAADEEDTAMAIEEIARTFAASAVDSGSAVGVAVAVTYRGRPPQFFSYGRAHAGTGALVGPDTIFEMGSVTKVFTTALLADAVLAGQLKLNEPLSRFEPLLGPMLRPTQQVTLLNLGDFTAGFPNTPPVCPPPPQLGPPGCLPNGRPTIAEYGAQDLLDYFRASSAPRMPAPYFYSDISTGLIGLILGANRGAPMGNDAVQGWLDLVRQRIIDPFGMSDTFLFDQDATPDQRARLAAGYSQPVVQATAENGAVVSCRPRSRTDPSRALRSSTAARATSPRPRSSFRAAARSSPRTPGPSSPTGG
jgi:CubicO group peptidase (beta-lactamase class C family)